MAKISQYTLGALLRLWDPFAHLVFAPGSRNPTDVLPEHPRIPGANESQAGV